jgi:electron transfer flavoprotein alpha/beta subunit
MDIVVCIKQVPETSAIPWDPTTGSLIRDGVEGILNPNDKNALEAALQIREQDGGTITALSMGPCQAEDTLREALSMGVDKAILLNDNLFAGSDTLATSYALHLAIKRISRFDLILCGKESWDAMTAHVGPQLSELLNLPQLTYATEITIHTNSVTIKQKLEDGFRVLESPLPALITVEKEMNQPRIPSMESIMNAYRDKEVVVWSHEHLGEDTARFGLKGSPTQSRAVYSKKMHKGNVTMLEGKPDEVARNLVQILRQKGL